MTMKINKDALRRAQGLDVETVTPETAEKKVKKKREPKTPKGQSRLKKFLYQDVMIDDDDETIEDVITLETLEDEIDTVDIDDKIEIEDVVVDAKPKSKRVKKLVTLTLGYSLAIGLTTMGGVYYINTSNLDVGTVVPKEITVENHTSILNGSPDDFDRLLSIYNSGGNDDEIIVDAPEVSDEAYEARIAKLQQEIRELKDELAQALERESDPNVIPERPETTIVEVPSVDKTNEEIRNLQAKLAASEAREKNLQNKLDKIQNP